MADEKCDGCLGLFPRAQLVTVHAMGAGMLPPQFCDPCMQQRLDAEAEDARAAIDDVPELRSRVAALELLVLRLVQEAERARTTEPGWPLDDMLTADERKLLTEEP